VACRTLYRTPFLLLASSIVLLTRQFANHSTDVCVSPCNYLRMRAGIVEYGHICHRLTWSLLVVVFLKVNRPGGIYIAQVLGRAILICVCVLATGLVTFWITLRGVVLCQ
jgi:hypothetical protein